MSTEAQGAGRTGQGAELELVAAIKDALGSPPARVLVGPGDDAAVVRAEGAAVVTSIDTVVDGVHFSLATHSAFDVGHKALATALSDIAAMGARPGEAYVAVVLPRGFEDALELVEGMRALAERSGVAIAGGDVVSGPALAVTVTVTGWVRSGEPVVLRSGARAGDLVGVTGELGGSGAGLRALQEGVRDGVLVERHRRPEPLLATGLALAGAGVSAMIDVSDGVATDAGHLARASGVTLELRLEDLPRAAGVDSAERAATDGDDYELLFTAPSDVRAAVEAAALATGTRVSWLGDVEPGGPACRMRAADGGLVDLSGYEHGR